MDESMLCFKFFWITHFDFSKVVQKSSCIWQTVPDKKYCICSNWKCILSIRQATNRFCLSPSKTFRFGATELKCQRLHRTTVQRVVREDFQESLPLVLPFPNAPLERWPSASWRAQLEKAVFQDTQIISKVICQSRLHAPPVVFHYVNAPQLS